MTLRSVDESNREAALRLRVSEEQTQLVASVKRSLEQVTGDPSLSAFLVYDGHERGVVQPSNPPVGFLALQVDAGVGFILRLLIDSAHQGKGYGRGALQAAIRYLERVPAVEMVATSHRAENVAMARLTRSLGFSDWQVPWTPEGSSEVYLRLGEFTPGLDRTDAL